MGGRRRRHGWRGAGPALPLCAALLLPCQPAAARRRTPLPSCAAGASLPPIRPADVAFITQPGLPRHTWPTLNQCMTPPPPPATADVTFMTTPGSHNDTYAESFHRDFFK